MQIEPEVIINGVSLTSAEAMTLRVQVAAGLYYYDDPDILGKDEHGRAMTDFYRRSLEHIQSIMMHNQPKGRIFIDRS